MFRVPFALATILPLPALADMSCAEVPATRFHNGMQVCVSDVLLDPTGRYDYGPENLVDSNANTAWCVDLDHTPMPPRIYVVIRDAAPFRRLIWENGYAKSDRTFATNARPKLIEFATDAGLYFDNLVPDSPSPSYAGFPIPARHEAFSITLREVYPGTQYRDLCLNGFTPDFWYEETHGQGN